MEGEEGEEEGAYAYREEGEDGEGDGLVVDGDRRTEISGWR